MAAIQIMWTMVILMVIQMCYGQDTISQQLLDRIDRLEKQGEAQAVTHQKLEQDFQDFSTKTTVQENAYQMTINHLQHQLIYAKNVVSKLEDKLAHLEENLDNTDEHDIASDNALPHLEEKLDGISENDVTIIYKIGNLHVPIEDKDDSDATEPVTEQNHQEKINHKLKTDNHKDNIDKNDPSHKPDNYKVKTDKNDKSHKQIQSESKHIHKLIQAQWLNKHQKIHKETNKNGKSDHSNSNTKQSQEDSENKQEPNQPDKNESSNTKTKHHDNSNTEAKSNQANSEEDNSRIKTDASGQILSNSNKKHNQNQADPTHKHLKHHGKMGNSNSYKEMPNKSNRKNKNHNKKPNSNSLIEPTEHDTKEKQTSKESNTKDTYKLIGNSNNPNKKTHSNNKLDKFEEELTVEEKIQSDQPNEPRHQMKFNRKKQKTGNSNQKSQGEVIRERRLDPLPIPAPVAFHALLEGNEHKHLGYNQIIKYNNTIYNKGEGYDAIEGVFTAPRPGIYIFSASLNSAANDYSTFWAELTKEDTPLARINIYGHRGVADQSSVTAVTHLELGQQVWVRIIEGSDISVWGDKYSYFTGALLHAD